MMGYYLVGDGKKQPYRLKMRTRVVLERQRDPGDAAWHAACPT